MLMVSQQVEVTLWSMLILLMISEGVMSGLIDLLSVVA